MSIKNANDKNYLELINNDFTIVDFYSTSCIPCKGFARVLEDLSLDFPFLNIVKVNVTDYGILGIENKVEAVPTILFIKNGKEIDREVGSMSEEEVIEKISQHYYGE